MLLKINCKSRMKCSKRQNQFFVNFFQQDCVRVYQAVHRLPSFTDILTGYQGNHNELINECFTTPLQVISAGGGGGGYLTKFNTGRLRPKVQPLTLLYTILAEKVPFYITPFYIPFIEKRFPFHIPTLEHCTPFLSPCNEANEQYYGRISSTTISASRFEVF